MKKKISLSLLTFVIVWAGSLTLAFYLKSNPDAFNLDTFPQVEFINKLGSHFFVFIQRFFEYVDFVAGIFSAWFTFLYNYLSGIVSKLVEFYEGILEIFEGVKEFYKRVFDFFNLFG
ncbi:MAG: hypothetical protein QXI16_03470 [Sulfolobaceae archaeon]